MGRYLAEIVVLDTLIQQVDAIMPVVTYALLALDHTMDSAMVVKPILIS